MQTGFLQEPIPEAKVSQTQIDKLAQAYKDDSNTRNLQSPLFKAQKNRMFLALCEGLTVRDALRRHNAIFENGIKEADIPLSYDVVKDCANEIGEQYAGDCVEDTIGDVRLFREWIKDVIQHIGKEHFGAAVIAALDVAHLDLPTEEKSWSTLVLDIPSLYDEDEDEYNEHILMLPLRWPGRHVIQRVWVEYIIYLMRLICALSV